MESTLVGVFESRESAEDARARLAAAGFGEGALSLACGDAAAPDDAPANSPHHSGPIARFFRSLFGEHHEAERSAEADAYREAFRRGAWALTVRASSEREIELAEQALNAAGAIDIDQRAREWRRAGAAARSSRNVSGAAAAETVPVVEEALEVGKRAVARGRVRVFSHAVEVPVEQTVRLREEQASVERRPADRLASADDLAAFREGTLEVREMAEEVVVRKIARVVAEVEITKRVTEHEEIIRDTVRRTEVDVERVEPPSPERGARAEARPAKTAQPEPNPRPSR
jgi:stress response protein YsnF